MWALGLSFVVAYFVSIVYQASRALETNQKQNHGTEVTPETALKMNHFQIEYCNGIIIQGKSCVRSDTNTVPNIESGTVNLGVL